DEQAVPRRHEPEGRPAGENVGKGRCADIGRGTPHHACVLGGTGITGGDQQRGRQHTRGKPLHGPCSTVIHHLARRAGSHNPGRPRRGAGSRVPAWRGRASLSGSKRSTWWSIARRET